MNKKITLSNLEIENIIKNAKALKESDLPINLNQGSWFDIIIRLCQQAINQ